MRRQTVQQLRTSERRHYLLMMLPALALVAIFNLYPNAGFVLAFKSYTVRGGIWGSPWIGLSHFELLFLQPRMGRIFFNTVYLSLAKLVGNLLIPLAFAILLNEIRSRVFKRTVQTVVYIPYFLSWVILAGVFREVFSTSGVINAVLELAGREEPVMFFGSNQLFPAILVGTDVWKNYGFNAIIFLAALTNISPELYESADMDGAGRGAKIARITVPLMVPTVILVATLGLQGILNAGFEQIFNMYNTLVYESSDILDTYIFRMGMQNNQFEFATAVGLIKSGVSFVFIITGYRLADRYAGYRMF